MPKSGPAYMHASIAIPGLTANQHTWDERDGLRMVERPDAHIISPSRCSSEYSLSCVIQHVNYTQVQNFDTYKQHYTKRSLILFEVKKYRSLNSYLTKALRTLKILRTWGRRNEFVFPRQLRPEFELGWLIPTHPMRIITLRAPHSLHTHQTE